MSESLLFFVVVVFTAFSVVSEQSPGDERNTLSFLSHDHLGAWSIKTIDLPFTQRRYGGTLFVKTWKKRGKEGGVTYQSKEVEAKWQLDLNMSKAYHSANTVFHLSSTALHEKGCFVTIAYAGETPFLLL